MVSDSSCSSRKGLGPHKCGQIPHPRRVVPAASGQPLSVQAEGNAVDTTDASLRGERRGGHNPPQAMKKQAPQYGLPGANRKPQEYEVCEAGECTETSPDAMRDEGSNTMTPSYLSFSFTQLQEGDASPLPLDSTGDIHTFPLTNVGTIPWTIYILCGHWGAEAPSHIPRAPRSVCQWTGPTP